MERLKELGQTAVALTDHGNLYAAISFYQAAKKAGIHPIIGCEVYVASRTRFDRGTALDRKRYHLVLLCENQTGYQNLVKLVSKACLEGFYQKPRVDWELLTQYHEGLIALSGCLAGEIPQLLLSGDYAAVTDRSQLSGSIRSGTVLLRSAESRLAGTENRLALVGTAFPRNRNPVGCNQRCPLPDQRRSRDAASVAVHSDRKNTG